MPESTMRAVVFDGPYKVSIQDRPIPQIQQPTDIIVKPTCTALCGSELHVFRGLETTQPGFIMGHEFTGIVTEVGAKVTSFAVGDQIVCPFTTSCGACFYCGRGLSSRCIHSLLLGSTNLDGAQAEYIRIPFADGSVMKAPSGINDEELVLMADIWPTGWFATNNAFKDLSPDEIKESTVVVIGCGPVGLCALINAADRKPKHLLAIDAVPDRLELARQQGAEPWNFKDDLEGLKRRVSELTDGRGADAVIEVVGLSPALRTAFDLLRPFGVISSVGVHNAEIPWTGEEAYGKNLSVQMGRCPVRSIFPQALEALRRKQHLLGFMADKIMPLEQAVEGYELFNQMKVQKGTRYCEPEIVQS